MRPSNHSLNSLAQSLDMNIPHPTHSQTRETLSAGGTVMIITKRALDIITLNQNSKKQSLLATTRKGEEYLDKGYYMELPVVYSLGFNNFISLSNNFYLHFLSLGWVSYNARIIEKFKKENSKLYSEIKLLVNKKRDHLINTEENFVRLKKLYQAYCIMIQYPFVENNYELFK